MLQNARRANPLVPWRTVWLALALVALPGMIAMTVTLVSTTSTTSNGGARPQAAPEMTAAGGSAACARRSAAVRSTRPGSRSVLVPPGATAVLLCRYAARGPRVRQLSITSGAIVSRLARELNALPPATGAYACPFDDGESVVADFSYASGPENPVSIALSGCQLATNGHVRRLGLDHLVIAQLDRLLPWLGRISGWLELCGGAAPGRCRPASGFTGCAGSRCLRADQVAIMHAVGRQYPNVRLRHGRFTARVEPGRYRLALLGDGPRIHGRVLARARVRVRLNRTTRVALQLSVK